MKRTPLILAAAVVLAGCTTPGSGGETPQEGLVIEQATLLDSRVQEGGSSQLILRLKNTNRADVTGLNAELSNLGGLSPVVVEGEGDGEGCGPVDISGTRDGVPGFATCVWELQAEEGIEEESTYPVTVTVTYDSELVMVDETLKFFFETGEDFTGSQVTTKQFSNGEVQMTTEHPSVVRSGDESIEMDLQVSNTGEGSIPGETGQRSVGFSYDGSLTEYYSPGDGCSSASFLTGERSTGITCALGMSGDEVQPSMSHNLGITTSYTYQRHRVLPLTVVPDETG